MYDPSNLRCTIFEAAKTLKEKLTKKLPKLRFPHYVTDIYTFDLLFHTPKCPPLPSSEFALEFLLHFPRWFVCGSSLEVIENECEKPIEWVVMTKHNIHSYSDHLHVGIENV